MGKAKYAIFKKHYIRTANVYDGGESEFEWQRWKAYPLFDARKDAVMHYCLGLDPAFADHTYEQIKRRWPGIRRSHGIKVDRVED